jgi:hypothetical protein
MATRLLDWTLNPIAALWFAVERPAQARQPGVVWIFESKPSDYVRSDRTGGDNSSPFTGRRTRIFRPRHITRRIIAQSGWFTVHKYLPEKKRFIALDENRLYRNNLTKVVVPASAFAQIRRELDRWGFNAAALYADIDALCRHLGWQNSLLADEAD